MFQEESAHPRRRLLTLMLSLALAEAALTSGECRVGSHKYSYNLSDYPSELPQLVDTDDALAAYADGIMVMVPYTFDNGNLTRCSKRSRPLPT